MRNASVNSPVFVPSRKQTELKKAFQSAKSFDEMLKTFKKMEKSFPESELGLECWKLADDGRPSEEVILFGKRALSIFIANENNKIPCFGNTSSVFPVINSHNHGSSFFIPRVLNLLGSACLDLKRYSECLSYLNWAERNLSKLEKDETDNGSRCSNNCVLRQLISNQHTLFKVKEAMGRIEEAAIHLRKVLEIKEKIMEEDCMELGEANKEVYAVYFHAVELKEAFPFCLKDLEMHTKPLGRNSLEVARMTRHLAVIYESSGEYEKSLEKNKLSQSILKKIDPDSPDLQGWEIECSSSLLINLGRNKEAVGVLKDVVSHADLEEGIRATALVYMAKALIYVACGFRDMSFLYEKMNDPETALSLIRRVLAIPKFPMNLLSQNSSKLFLLISVYGKEKEGIPYIEYAMGKLKKKFGPDHCVVGYAYGNLGAAYLKSSQLELAEKVMKNANDIMDATIGPNHLHSLNTSQMLATTYAMMGR